MGDEIRGLVLLIGMGLVFLFYLDAGAEDDPTIKSYGGGCDPNTIPEIREYRAKAKRAESLSVAKLRREGAGW